MVEKKVVVKYEVDGKQAQKGTSKLSGAMKKLAIVGIGGALAALAALGIALKSAVKLAGIQEKAIKDLTSAMKNNGTFSKKAASEAIAFAAALQKQSVFGDEAIISAQGLLVSLGRLKGEGLNSATQATADLAARLGIDLKSAASLVGKTLGSSTNALARYGVSVEGAVGSSERLESLTKNIADLFGGSAKAQTETFDGRVQQLKNSFGDLLEGIGFRLIPVLTTVVEKFKNVTDSINGIFEALDKMKKESEAPFQLQRKAANDLTEELKLLKSAYDDQRKAGANEGVLRATKELITSKQKLLSIAQIELSLLEAAQKKREETETGESPAEKARREADEKAEVQSAAASKTIATKAAENEELRQLDEEMAEEKREKDEKKLELEEENAARSAAIKAKYDKIAEKEDAKKAKADLTLARAQAQAKLDIESSFNTLISTATATKSLELFNIGKAGAIATATMKTWEAANNALASVPFPFNIAAAGLITAAGIANVVAIEAQPAPKFANGGLVQPTSGGTNVTMGEAGEQELGLPSSKVQSFLDEAGVNSSVPIETVIMLDKKVLVRALTSGQRKDARNKTN